MSKLEFFGRPLVAFDAYNKQHRRWFAEYIERRSWGQCPVRFIVPDDNGNLIDVIKNAMLKYQVEREFGKKSI